MIRFIQKVNTQTFWHRAFGLLLLVYFFVIVLTLFDYGITSDEAGHVAYGEALVRWYTSGLQDQAVFESKNTWLYGGLFDFGVAVVSQILPLNTYDARHFCNAVVGLLGVVAAYRLGCLLGGTRAGFLAALFLILIPRYYGHAFNNPKDIPVAVAYLWSLYFITKCVRAYPDLSRQLLVKTGLAIGAALAIRIGGLLLVLYLVAFLFLMWVRSADRTYASFIRLVKQLLGIGIVAYGVTLIFWPYLTTHPVMGIWEAVHTFGKFPEIHFTFFEGIYVGSNETPWYYAPKWLLLTLPEHILLGVILATGLALAKCRFKVTYLLLVVSAFFPIVYAVVTQMPLYDGIRHLLFVMPPMAIVSALGVEYLLRSQASVRWATGAGLVLLVFWALRNLVVLHPNQYVYFNHLFAGGVAEAAKQYDTDYWENSYPQGVDWVREQPSEDKRRIRTHYERVRETLDNDAFEWIHLAENADYYLAITRYDRHKLIAGEILHVVKADGAPLLYVIHPDTSYAKDPFFLNAPYKFAYFGEFYEGLGDVKRAKKAYEMAIEMRIDTLVTQHRMWGYYRALGLLYLNTGEMDKALAVVQQAVTFDPEQAEAWYLMAQVLTVRGDYGGALEAIQEALFFFPDRDTYLAAYVNIGVALQQTGAPEKALSIYKSVLERQPERFDLLMNSGIACFALENYRQAIVFFEKASHLSPDDVEVYLGLIQAYSNLGELDQALALCEEALSKHANHEELLYVVNQVKTLHQNH